MRLALLDGGSKKARQHDRRAPNFISGASSAAAGRGFCGFGAGASFAPPVLGDLPQREPLGSFKDVSLKEARLAEMLRG
ncbi:hypothetical protein IVA79_11735 [Bradyrhizobium sp. 138]|uniref:hypothetical protein n=1 Tax=Bradyrhizobium sp. 138 TaxID=2782615 RepID=UPI001FF8B45B|nr:hypothetical protein [Bradyrhizobium sp. 138]MCK1734610.1 hypothetical protein [Bradyrhizobium sp. 138]